MWHGFYNYAALPDSLLFSHLHSLSEISHIWNLHSFFTLPPKCTFSACFRFVLTRNNCIIEAVGRARVWHLINGQLVLFTPRKASDVLLLSRIQWDFRCCGMAASLLFSAQMSLNLRGMGLNFLLHPPWTGSSYSTIYALLCISATTLTNGISQIGVVILLKQSDKWLTRKPDDNFNRRTLFS